MKYSEFQPTCFDPKGYMLDEDRQDWLVVPVGQSRDSDCLSQSNFKTALEILKDESDTCEVHRFGHWTCGWFEIIIVSPDRLSEVESIQDSLENYPVLDEEDFSQREWDFATEYWQNMDLRDRIDLCKKFDVSIFAARHDSIPSNDNGMIYDYLRTP